MQFRVLDFRHLKFGCLLGLAFIGIHSPARATLAPRDVDLTYAQNAGPVSPTSIVKTSLPNGQPPYTDTEPVFASDLHTIFYASNRALPGATQSSGFNIWRVDSDGSFQLQVPGTVGTDQEWPAVSADGNGLAYSSRDASGRAQIHVLNLASGNDFQLTDGPGDKIHPTWSPQGTIAFQDNETGINKIWLLYPVYDATSTTSPRTQLTGVGSWDSANATKVDTDPAWEPGGGHIAFTRNDGAHTRIWLIFKPSINVVGTVAAGQPFPFTDFTAGGVGSDERYPAWRPQGPSFPDDGNHDLLVFASTRKTTSTDPLVTVNGATRVGSTFGIYRAPIVYTDSTQAQPYTETQARGFGQAPAVVVAEDAQFGLTYQNITPAWSPDTRNDPVTGQPHVANRIVYSSSSYAATPPSDSPPVVVIPTPYPPSRPAFDLWSSEVQDFTPPSLQNPPIITPKITGPGDTVTISAKFADLNAGMAHVYAQIKNPNSYLQDPRLPSLRNSLSGANDGDLFFDGHRIYQLVSLSHPYVAPAPPAAADAYYNTYQEIGYQPIDPVTYSYSDGGGENLPLDINTSNGLLFLPTRDTQPPLTIELTRDPSDPSGATYSASWPTDPNLDTDYLVDLIAVDRVDNAIDYDNVGGFSTKSFAAAKSSILLVADYTTPQRFLQPRGGQMPGEKFGVESWLTDNPLAKVGNNQLNGGSIDPEYYVANPPADGDVIHDLRGTAVNNIDRLNLVVPGLPLPLPAPPVLLPNFLWGFENTLGLGSWIDLRYNGGLRSPFPPTSPPIVNGDQVDTITSTATSGSFSLSVTYAGRTVTTGPIPWNATAAQVQTALGGIAPNSLGLANVWYGDAVASGGALPTAIVVTFTSALAGHGVGLSANNINLGGGTVTVGASPASGQTDIRYQTNVDAGWPRREDSFDPSTNYDSYDIWRILCRGPIPAAVLNAYGPISVLEPDPTDVTKTVKKDVYTRCVVWASPFTADDFVGPGTILDPVTQATIAQFLDSGGRMYLTGQDVAWALSLGDPNSTTPAHLWLQKYFGVKFNQDRVLPLGADITSAGGPIGSRWTADGGPGPDSPFSALADYFSNDPSVAKTEYEDFPAISHYGAHDQDFPDVLTLAGAGVADYNQGGSVDAASTFNPASGAKTFFSGFGLEGISEGFDDIDWTYKIPDPTSTTGGTLDQPVKQWTSQNERSILMHAVVDSMRENSITGQVNLLEPDGRLTPFPNALVTAKLDDGSNKTVATAISRSDGSFTLSGLPTGEGAGGNFIFHGDITEAGITVVHRIEGGPDVLVYVTRPGYSQVHDIPHVHGHFGHPRAYTNSGGEGPLNELVSIAPPGTITGTVTDASTKAPIAGATVTIVNVPFRDIQITTTTDLNGKYKFVNVPAAPPAAPGLPSSSYVMTFTAVGYVPLVKSTDDATGGPIYVPSSTTVNENAALTPIPAPLNLTAVAGNGVVTLSWTATAGATSYNIYRGTSAGGESTTPVASVSGATYADRTVTNGTTYFYYVTAVVGGGESKPSNEASATPLAPAGAPLSLTAVSSPGTITLSWTASAGAASYNVYRGTSAGGESTTPIAKNVTATTYADTTVTDNTTYFYYVTAVNAGGESGKSNEASATTPPAAPASLQAIAGNARVALAWAASTGATSYNVKRASVSGGPYTTIKSGLTNTNYLDLAVTNGNVYFYVVSAVGAGGESSNSGEASANPQAPSNAPSSLVAVPGTRLVNLSWTGTPTAASYNVKRSTVSGGPYTSVGSSTTPSFTDRTPSDGTTYYYVVTAVNGGGESGNSNQASATPVDAPTLTAASGAGAVAVNLSWPAVVGASGYTIERMTGTGQFTPLAQLDATKTSYTDSGLAAHTSYSYRMKALSGAGSSDYSNTASITTGPDTISGNVTFTVNGTSKPFPGAIIKLLANGSTTPLQSTTTDSAGNYSFNNLADGTYTVSAAASSQMTPQTAQVTVQSTVNNGAATQNFSLTPLYVFQSGLSLVSLPYDYSETSLDAADVFGLPILTGGVAYVAGYDPVAGVYGIYPNLPGSGTKVLPGRGYWIDEAQAQPFLEPGNPVSSPFDETLPAGWNLIGDPFNGQLAFSSIQVKSPVAVGSTPANTFMSLQTAMSARVVGPAVWGYSSRFNSYVAASSLQPFNGYWLYVFPQGSGSTGITLRFNSGP